jgi:hypothetical protein
MRDSSIHVPCKDEPLIDVSLKTHDNFCSARIDNLTLQAFGKTKQEAMDSLLAKIRQELNKVEASASTYFGKQK